MKLNMENYKSIYEKRANVGGGYPIVPQVKNLDYFMNILQSKKTNGEKGAIYIGIPFCYARCTFCPFFQSLDNEKKRKQYLTALKKEIEMYSKSDYIMTSEFSALYFGGGTPSCLSTDEIKDILNYCMEIFSLSKNAEITFEASTINFDEEKMRVGLDCGVNRISLGVQTFNDYIRKLLNLKDIGKEAYQTIETAHRVGCDNVDIDLIYNLPGQTMDICEKDIEKAIELGVENISYYSLAVFPKTKLAKQLESGDVPPIGNTAFEIDLFLRGVDILTDAGYKRQHVSLFILPGKEHIYSPMTYGPYDLLGCGSGARGSIQNYVYSNTRTVDKYDNMVNMKKYPIDNSMKLSKMDNMAIFMRRGLLMGSIDKKAFQSLFGVGLESAFPEIINNLTQRGLININEREIRLTDVGVIWAANVGDEFASVNKKRREK